MMASMMSLADDLPIGQDDLPYIETLSLKRSSQPKSPPPPSKNASETSTPIHTTSAPRNHFKVPAVLTYSQPPPPPPLPLTAEADEGQDVFQDQDTDDDRQNYSFDSDTYDGMFYNSSSGSEFDSSFDEAHFSTPSKDSAYGSFNNGAYSGFLLPPQSPEHEGKMCVILDMDETLVHSEFLDGEDYMYRQEEDTRQTDAQDEPDFFLDVCDGVAVRVRPGLTEFLTKLAEHFEVGVFTAAEEVYACPVLDTIDPTGLISFRLYRDSTSEFNGVSFVKNISRVGRDMRRTVLVDNNIQATLASPDNSLVCVDYYGDPADNELEGILDSLMEMDQMADIRPQLQARYQAHTQQMANAWSTF
jgi:RNA polymerase II subunit A small phosphatase-like protein